MQMPMDFDPYDYLKFAWGIMGGDEVVEVKLRLSEKVAYRVRESDWPVSAEAGGRKGRTVYADLFWSITFWK